MWDQSGQQETSYPSIAIEVVDSESMATIKGKIQQWVEFTNCEVLHYTGVVTDNIDKNGNWRQHQNHRKSDHETRVWYLGISLQRDDCGHDESRVPGQHSNHSTYVCFEVILGFLWVRRNSCDNSCCSSTYHPVTLLIYILRISQKLRTDCPTTSAAKPPAPREYKIEGSRYGIIQQSHHR